MYKKKAQPSTPAPQRPLNLFDRQLLELLSKVKATSKKESEVSEEGEKKFDVLEAREYMRKRCTCL